MQDDDATHSEPQPAIGAALSELPATAYMKLVRRLHEVLCGRASCSFCVACIVQPPSRTADGCALSMANKLQPSAGGLFPQNDVAFSGAGCPFSSSFPSRSNANGFANRCPSCAEAIIEQRFSYLRCCRNSQAAGGGVAGPSLAEPGIQ